MSIEIKVPVLPESVADATIAAWHKKVGDSIRRDENLVDLETDKVVLEVPAPTDGIVEKILVEQGKKVISGTVLAVLKAMQSSPVSDQVSNETNLVPSVSQSAAKIQTDLSPAVRRLAAEKEIDVTAVKGSGKSGRIVKADLQVSSALSAMPSHASTYASSGTREEKRVPMTRLRQRIAERLLTAKQTTAMLTTFNEVNLQVVNDLRQRYKESFEKKHGARLGLMSFFTKAVVEALKRFPDVNASIDGEEIIYHSYYDIGIAVSTDRGLVVPILRDADQMSYADIEAAIKVFSDKARNNQISLDDMKGGTFTITNGGAFGSLLSTPILNPPQSAILGMHGIQNRPVAENNQIVIRPMMYLALSYDHRIIDGKQSVLFLRTIKELLENPLEESARFILGL